MQVSDALLGECVARQGGYEEVERHFKWVHIANGLGMRKDMAEKLKQRYEDMLRQSAEMDANEDEDEDEEYEVEQILDSRTDAKGNIEYLVKWKFDGEDDDGGDLRDSTTWEPREHLACPELLEAFEAAKKQKKQPPKGDAAAAAAATAAAEPPQEPPQSNGAQAAAAAAEEGAEDAGRKRKHADAEEAANGDGRVAGGTADGGSGKYGLYEKILRTCKPKLGKPLLFEVLMSDQQVVMLPNSKLRAEAPLMLCDFYEARLQFPPA